MSRTCGSMSPVARITENAASMRRRTSTAYCPRRSARVASARRSSTGTTFCTTRTLFPPPPDSNCRQFPPNSWEENCPPGVGFPPNSWEDFCPPGVGFPPNSWEDLGGWGGLEALYEQGALDLAGRGRSGERIDDREAAGLLERGEPAGAERPKRVEVGARRA